MTNKNNCKRDEATNKLTFRGTDRLAVRKMASAIPCAYHGCKRKVHKMKSTSTNDKIDPQNNRETNTTKKVQK